MKSTNAYIRIFRIVGASVALLMLISFCACGAPGNGAAMSISDIPQYTLPPVAENVKPVQGGSLTFPIPKNPATLNPLKIKNVELFNLFSLVYECPVRFDAAGRAQPELAETWSVDNTGTVWTFKLRQGVKWQGDHGGFTSADILYTIGLIKSYSASDSTFAKYNNSIVSYSAPDDYTVTLTLSSPGRLGIYYMTFPVMCKAYCEHGNIDNLKPVGTGPYKVKDYDPYEKMQLGVNSQWWKEAPYIQELTAVCYDDHNAELSAFNEGKMDFLTTSVITVNTHTTSTHPYVDYMTQYYDCLVPNMASGLFKDINIRKAIAYALDKRDIISKALLGHAVAADYPVAPDSYLSGGSSNIFEYNQQKARELLELSGWKNRDEDPGYEKVNGSNVTDLTFNLLVPANKENTYRHDVAENIASQLAECGMSVTVLEVEASDYLQRLQSGNFDMALCSFYLNQYPDFTFMLGTGGSENYGKFSDAQMDKLLSGCNTALGEETVKTAFTSMEEYFIETVPHIGLYFRTNALIYDSSITVSDSIRDLNLFTTIPKWYRYTTATAQSTATPAASGKK